MKFLFILVVFSALVSCVYHDIPEQNLLHNYYLLDDREIVVRDSVGEYGRTILLTERINKYKVVDKYILLREKIDYNPSDGVYTHGSNIYYWIINTSNKSLIGPYLYEDFVEKCNEFKIEIF